MELGISKKTGCFIRLEEAMFLMLVDNTRRMLYSVVPLKEISRLFLLRDDICASDHMRKFSSHNECMSKMKRLSRDLNESRDGLRPPPYMLSTGPTNCFCEISGPFGLETL